MLNQNKESIDIFDRALKIEPDSAFALGCKGEALRKLGRYEESLVWFEKALKIDPDNYYALEKKGEALHNLGRHEESLVWFEKALKIDPDNAFALKRKDDILRSRNSIENTYRIHKIEQTVNNHDDAVTERASNLEKIKQSIFKYAVAISYASENKDIVNTVAKKIKEKNIHVFYDEFEKYELWGKDLSIYLQEILEKNLVTSWFLYLKNIQ